jgi:FkbM family methyltransferase
MKFLYGIENNNIDVTEIVYNKLVKDNVIKIPKNDHTRANYFSDPLVGILKSLFIKNNGETLEINYSKECYIDIITNNIYIDEIPSYIKEIYFDINDKLKYIHSNLKLNHGTINDELPEQKMSVRYLTGNEKVLEIGGNIGRNSLVISYILKQKTNDSNLVVLESDPNIAEQLKENKLINSMNFYIENSALSKRRLIQKDWDTIPSDKLLPGYKWVNTIDYEDLIKKYNIIFDTLVLDCEGAFYYILMDMPEILNNIKLIIMENDYHNIEHKNYVDNVLNQNNFYRDYVEEGGWGCCYNNFFEVWKRN